MAAFYRHTCQSFARYLQVFKIKPPRFVNGLQIIPSPVIQRGMAGHGKAKRFFIFPSRFADRRFFKAVRYYMLLAGIPCAMGITFVNVFIGPAQLAEIPDDYEPMEYEYHRHPITRFLAKYVVPTPQQEYEKMAHHLAIEQEKIEARAAEKTVKRLMRKRGDGHWYYYPVGSPVDTFDEELKD